MATGMQQLGFLAVAAGVLAFAAAWWSDPTSPTDLAEARQIQPGLAALGTMGILIGLGLMWIGKPGGPTRPDRVDEEE